MKMVIRYLLDPCSNRAGTRWCWRLWRRWRASTCGVEDVVHHGSWPARTSLATSSPLPPTRPPTSWYASDELITEHLKYQWVISRGCGWQTAECDSATTAPAPVEGVPGQEVHVRGGREGDAHDTTATDSVWLTVSWPTFGSAEVFLKPPILTALLMIFWMECFPLPMNLVLPLFPLAYWC